MNVQNNKPTRLSVHRYHLFNKETHQKFFPTHEEFEKDRSRYFNDLRSAAKYYNLNVIENIKSSLSKSQYLSLLHDKNDGYSDCAIIHYAARYDSGAAIQALVGHLSKAERLEIFKLPFELSGCHALLFAASMNDLNNSDYSFNSAVKIKELTFSEEDHQPWLTLLESQQKQLDTPLHYAARKKEPKLLELLIDGLTPDEKIKLFSIKNKEGNTPLNTCYLNLTFQFETSPKAFLDVFRKPFSTPEEWVAFLIENKIIDKKDTHEHILCFINAIKNELSKTLINQLFHQEQKNISASNLQPEKDVLVDDLAWEDYIKNAASLEYSREKYKLLLGPSGKQAIKEGFITVDHFERGDKGEFSYILNPYGLAALREKYITIEQFNQLTKKYYLENLFIEEGILALRNKKINLSYFLDLCFALENSHISISKLFNRYTYTILNKEHCTANIFNFDPIEGLKWLFTREGLMLLENKYLNMDQIMSLSNKNYFSDTLNSIFNDYIFEKSTLEWLASGDGAEKMQAIIDAINQRKNINDVIAGPQQQSSPIIARKF